MKIQSIKNVLHIVLFVALLCIIGIIILMYYLYLNDDHWITVNHIAADEPITMEQCAEIYYQNEKNFNTVKDYILSLAENRDKECYFVLTDETYKKSVPMIDIQNVFAKLKDVGVQTIKAFVEEGRIEFYIDGTGSSWYGVLWKNSNHSHYTNEKQINDKWYIYFFGGT